jgi:hypothetical protein
LEKESWPIPIDISSENYNSPICSARYILSRSICWLCQHFFLFSGLPLLWNQREKWLNKYIITYECHDNAPRMWKVVQLEKYFDFSLYSHHFSLLSLTSLLSAPEREVTSPSDFKVVGALVYNSLFLLAYHLSDLHMSLYLFFVCLYYINPFQILCFVLQMIKAHIW